MGERRGEEAEEERDRAGGATPATAEGTPEMNSIEKRERVMTRRSQPPLPFCSLRPFFSCSFREDRGVHRCAALLGNDNNNNKKQQQYGKTQEPYKTNWKATTHTHTYTYTHGLARTRAPTQTTQTQTKMKTTREREVDSLGCSRGVRNHTGCPQ